MDEVMLLEGVSGEMAMPASMLCEWMSLMQSRGLAAGVLVMGCSGRCGLGII